jgi:hypothetical protein
MFDRTPSRNFLASAKTQPKADQPSSWLSQGRKEKISSCFSELGALCVFAGVISFSILQADIQPRISHRFGYAAR